MAENLQQFIDTLKEQLRKARTENARLQERVEEAEIKLGFFESAGFPTPQDILEKIDGYKVLAEEAVERGTEAVHIFYWMHQGRERWRVRTEQAEALAERRAWLVEELRSHIKMEGHGETVAITHEEGCHMCHALTRTIKDAPDARAAIEEGESEIASIGSQFPAEEPR